MRRFFFLSLWTTVLLVGTAPSTLRTATAQETPSGNGDVNADGGLDIADPLYILVHMFLGGPAPVPIECPDVPDCPPNSTAGIPVTGQNECFNTFGAVIPCNDQQFPGQDGFFQEGCSFSGRFIDNSDRTVTDVCTGLMWTQDTIDVDGDVNITENDSVDWQTALVACANLNLAGFSDWRLPNLRELESLAEFNRDFERAPSVNRLFGLVPPGTYWSSTTDIQDTPWAWFVVYDFGGSVVSTAAKSGGKMNVLAVRTVNQ